MDLRNSRAGIFSDRPDSTIGNMVTLSLNDFNYFCLPGAIADYEEVLVGIIRDQGDETEDEDAGDDSTVASMDESRGAATDDEDVFDALFDSHTEGPRRAVGPRGAGKKSLGKSLYDVSLYPAKFASAFNSGDIHRLEDLIDEHCSDDFVFSTPGNADEVHGRYRYQEFFCSILEDLPDAVHRLEYSKVLRDRNCGAIHIVAKVNFAATRCAYMTSAIEKMFEGAEVAPPRPTHSDSGVGGAAAAVAESKDEFYADRQYKRFSQSKTTYRALGSAYSRYTLNDHNEICRLMLRRKFNEVEEFSLKDDDDMDSL